MGVLHPQDRVTAQAFVRPEANDALKLKRLAATAGAIPGRRQVWAECAGTADAGRVRIGDECGAAVGTEVAGADRGRPAAEMADAGVEEVQQAAAEVGCEGAPHGRTPRGR